MRCGATWRRWPEALAQRDDLFVVPLTPASMVPNTVTPLPDEDVEEEEDGDGAVPAQPETSRPVARTARAARIDFTAGLQKTKDVPL